MLNNIKRIGFLLLLSYMHLHTFAQTGTMSIAPFKIRLTNGAGYTYKQLPPDKQVVLIYFSPTCDKCKAFAATLIRNKSVIRDKLIVMISYENIRDVITFDDTYHLSDMPNIKIGSEGYTFIVQKYYNIQHFPFLAIYNKQAHLQKIIRNEEDPDKIISQLKE